MNPREFLDTAEDLAVGDREADWRSAVSRAYYAAFHVGRMVLIRCGFAVPDAAQCHTFVAFRLANCGHPPIADAGNTLAELRRLRNLADYNLSASCDQRQSQRRVWEAEGLVDLLETALAAPVVLTQITTAIRDYELNVLKQVTWKP